MKRLLVLFAFLFIAYTIANAQWVQKHSGTPVNMSDAVSDQIFWAGRWDATAGTFVTTDGGQTWTSSTFVDPKGAPVYCIDALNADTAYVVTSEIFKTTNRGNTWVKQITTFATGFANCIHFFDSNNGVATGDPNGGYFEIYTTTNGGDNWVRVPSSNIPAPLAGEMGIVSSFSAYNNTFWFATSGAANEQRIIRSTDRGYTWTLLTSFSIPNLATPTIEFRDSQHGIFVGNGYLIFRTSNGGSTWTTDSLPSWVLYMDTPAYVPGTAATYVATVIGLSGIEQLYISLISTDDGATWKKMDSWQSPAFSALSAQQWTSANSGWMCLVEKGIYKWPGYTGKHIWRAPAVINFGNQGVGDIGVPSGISIGNYGTSATTVNNFSFSSSEFSMVSSPSTPLTLQPWNAADLNIKFSPHNRGIVTDSLTISSDAINYPSLTVKLIGKGLKFSPLAPNYIYATSDSMFTFTLSSLNPSPVGSFDGIKIEGITTRPSDSVVIGISTTTQASILYRIDPVLGACMQMFEIPIGDMRAIAYSPSGTLFAGAKNGNLYKIGADGSTTLFGTAAGKDYMAFSFNPQNGKLYASVSTSTPKDGIYTVDTLTGAVTLVGQTGDAKGTLSIAFDAGGNLYGLKGGGISLNQLISINPANGTGTAIGTLGRRTLQAIILSKIVTDIKDNTEEPNLLSYELHQNYPNPFNPKTTISYSLKENSVAKLSLLNILGEEIAVLVNKEQDKGYHKVEFDATKLTSGVYFYQLRAGAFVQTKKMLLLR